MREFWVIQNPVLITNVGFEWLLSGFVSILRNPARVNGSLTQPGFATFPSKTLPKAMKNNVGFVAYSMCSSVARPSPLTTGRAVVSPVERLD